MTPHSSAPYRLYHYWRSSSSWRVRFALEWKGILYEAVPVNLLNGESESPEHLKRNPAGFVPVLEVPTDPIEYLTESLSIIRYLEESHPEAPSLFPKTPLARAKVWALAEVINSGTQPIQNIPVMAMHSSDPDEQKRWSRHFIEEGLSVYERLCSQTAGRYSFGDELSLADLCLMPQLYNAERFQVSWDSFPHISRIEKSCRTLSAYQKSHPDQFKPIDFKG